MIKTAAIIAASAASLGASTTTPQNPTKAAPAHFEITAGPLHIVRKDGDTHFNMDAASDSLLRIELASGKTLNIQL